MDAVVVVLLAVAAIVLVRALTQPDEDEDLDGDFDPRVPGVALRVQDLAGALTGRPEIDRALQNRLLALGPPAIPALLRALTDRLRQPEAVAPSVLARLEETLADFGLSSLEPVLSQLARVAPTSPQGASLLRVLDRLGPAGAAQALERLVVTPELGAYLPRFRIDAPSRDARSLLRRALVTTPAARQRAALDALAGLIATHPGVVSDLWASWDDRGRATLLAWLADWRPLAVPSLVTEGLASSAASVRVWAARLAQGLPPEDVRDAVVHALLDPTSRLLDPQGTVRTALVDALADWGEPRDTPLLAALCGDSEERVALAASAALLMRRGEVAQALERGVDADPGWALVDAARRGQLEPVLAALDDASRDLQRLSCALLAPAVGVDPRARERLTRAVEGRDAELAAHAVLALARGGDPQAGELAPRPVRPGMSQAAALALRRAVSLVGDSAAAPIARRLRGETGPRADALLSMLRALPLAPIVPTLLRSLEAAQGARAEFAIAATLAAGGEAVRAALDEAIEQPGRGLLAPALQYYALYGAPSDVSLFLRAYERHPALRGLALALLELQGGAARERLRAYIEAGGDDAVLLPLEARLDLLEACHATH